MSLGPFDLTGGPFLALYSAVLVSAGIASVVLPARLRPEGRPGRPDGEDELAFLAGGVPRLADVATVRLLDAGAMVVQGRSQLQAKPGARGNTPVERAILSMAKPATWPAVLRAVWGESGSIQQRLAAKGLLLDPAETLRLRLLGTAPLLLALAFGATKLVIGVGRGKPVGYLALLLTLTAVLAVVRWAKTTRLTREGSRLLERERNSAQRLRRAPVRDEVPQSVALFGTAVLAGSILTDFHAMRRSNGGDTGGYSGSDGGSSGCGGSGCGGGGCGGCGGS